MEVTLIQRFFGAIAFWFFGMALVYYGMELSGSASPRNPAWQFVSGFWSLVGWLLEVGAVIAVILGISIVVSKIGNHFDEIKARKAQAIRDAWEAEEHELRRSRERKEQVAREKEYEEKRQREWAEYDRIKKAQQAALTAEDAMKKVMEQITKGA